MKRLRGTLRIAAISITAGALLFATGVSNQNTKMVRFETATSVAADGSTIAGSAAKLTRSEDAVWLSINTTGLLPGAYTVWWVLFNNPEACVDGCSGDDLGNPAVMGSVFFATNGVVDLSQTGHFRAHLAEGEMPSAPGSVLLPGPALLDAEKAEIHVVIRYHGPVVDRILMKQLTTHWGGCSVPGPAVVVDPVPADRVYPCYDPQATVFRVP